MKLTRGSLFAGFISCLMYLSFSCANAGNKQGFPTAELNEEEKFNLFVDSLKQSGSTALNTANEIRHYLAQKIDLGISKDSLAFNYHQIPWDQLSAFHCIELFEQNTLTAKCGLASYILAKLYDHAGYESYIYNCGFKDTKFTHQFVLLKMNDKLIIQDSFFDITVTDPQNNPKDFLQLLSEIKSWRLSNAVIEQKTVLIECWLNSQAELDSLLETSEIYRQDYKNQVKEIIAYDKRLKVLVERNFRIARFRDEGMPESYLSLYLKPLGVINGNSGKDDYSLKNLISAIVLN